MFLEFIYAFISTIGFSILFNIPKKNIIKASFAGAAGWIAFAYSKEYFSSLVFASFIGACVVSIISEIFARKFKDMVTVFIIPGIIPLVPGAGMYYSMLAIIEKDFNKFAAIGSETIFIAGSIAAAILIVSSITRILWQCVSRYQNKKHTKNF